MNGMHFLGEMSDMVASEVRSVTNTGASSICSEAEPSELAEAIFFSWALSVSYVLLATWTAASLLFDC